MHVASEGHLVSTFVFYRNCGVGLNVAITQSVCPAVLGSAVSFLGQGILFLVIMSLCIGYFQQYGKSGYVCMQSPSEASAAGLQSGGCQAFSLGP